MLKGLGYNNEYDFTWSFYLERHTAAAMTQSIPDHTKAKAGDSASQV